MEQFPPSTLYSSQAKYRLFSHEVSMIDGVNPEIEGVNHDIDGAKCQLLEYFVV